MKTITVLASGLTQEFLSATFIKFCLVGFSGVLVDMSVFWLFSSVYNVMHVGAIKLISGSVAMLSNFYWNDHWTFRNESGGSFKFKKLKSRLICFVIICGIGLILGILVVRVLSETIGINIHVANFGAIIAATLWNYFMNSLMSWRKNTRN